MKKISLFATLFISSFTLLAACDEKTAVDYTTLTAQAEDFETYFYESDRYSLTLHEDDLTIMGTMGINVEDDRKSAIDEVMLSYFESTEEELTAFFQKEFSDAKVEVQGNQYLITADHGLSLEFTKFKDHIIVDAEGMEYIRKAK
ncbi:MAG: protein-disulfide isomerase [Solibacillus sp.]